ncbi:MAG: SRPBCC domain-containing protein [Gemmatimonadetes bacterium]|nr:MAG: SRPBCC domain-containing protein [Gemmatimonadota bacterium]
MNPETVRALQLRKHVAASPEEVFDAWTQPERMARWCCPDPNATVDVEIDLRVGGAFMIRMHIEGGPYTASGTYREVERPRRLVYTWDWQEEAHRMGVDTVVTVEFTPVDGGTEVTLVHEGFPTEDARTGHEEGWTACLARL